MLWITICFVMHLIWFLLWFVALLPFYSFRICALLVLLRLSLPVFFDQNFFYRLKFFSMPLLKYPKYCWTRKSWKSHLFREVRISFSCRDLHMPRLKWLKSLVLPIFRVISVLTTPYETEDVSYETTLLRHSMLPSG